MGKKPVTAPLEKNITRHILAELNKLPMCYAVKTHGGPYGAGQPDIIGSYQGRAFAFEVKRPGRLPTPRQIAMLSRWQAARAITGVVHNAKEALEMIRKEVGCREE